METKTIYIADDDANIREIITTFLSSDGYVIKAFETGDGLLEAFWKQSCDLVILDVMMPGRDGFEVCRELRKNSTVPIILLTARDSDNDYAMGYGLGGDDYITKPFSAMALLMRVRAIFRRIDYERRNQKSLTCQNVSAGSLLLEEEQRQILCNDKPMNLSPTEYEVLRYLLKHQDKPVSRNELLEHVWGFDKIVETRATDDTVRRLRQKLEGSDVNIAAVWGYGFRLEVHA